MNITGKMRVKFYSVNYNDKPGVISVVTHNSHYEYESPKSSGTGNTQAQELTLMLLNSTHQN